jgi:PTS system ascorbate-specific IIA component
MTVGLLVITHDRIGADLLSTATKLLGICPLATEAMEVPLDCEPVALCTQAKARIASLDQGEGVLVLTDMYGSTPGNIASSLQQDGRVLVIAGINLPMLVRVLNYPRLTLEQLGQKALSGGSDGVLMCHNNDESNG